MGLRDIRSTFMPYCIEQQADGRYAVLNREYKPVGFWTTAFITYADHPTLVRIKGLTPLKASQISWEGKRDTNLIFLYSDACIPTRSAANMNAYLNRLAVLGKLQLEGDVPDDLPAAEVRG